MHPAKEGFAALPFFDEFDLSTVDVLLISQYVRFPFLRSVHYGTHSCCEERRAPLGMLL